MECAERLCRKTVFLIWITIKCTGHIDADQCLISNTFLCCIDDCIRIIAEYDIALSCRIGFQDIPEYDRSAGEIKSCMFTADIHRTAVFSSGCITGQRSAGKGDGSVILCVDRTAFHS